MGPSNPNCYKIKLRTSFFCFHLGRTDSQLDVEENMPDRAEDLLYVHESRPDRAEGPLYAQGTGLFWLNFWFQQNSYPNAKSIHILGP